MGLGIGQNFSFAIYCDFFNGIAISSIKIKLFYFINWNLQICRNVITYLKKKWTFTDLHLCIEINYYNIFRYTLWHNLKSFRQLIFIFLLRFLKIIFIIFLAFVGFKKKKCNTIFFQKTTFNMEYLYQCAPLFIEQVRKIG